MCGDRQVSMENCSPAMALYKPKIRLLRNDEHECILGVSGNVESTIMFERAFIKGFMEKKAVELNLKKEYRKMSALAYYSDGTIHFYEGMTTPIHLEAPYVGIGSGSAFAIGALYHGAKLKESVRIASLCDPFSGFGIQYVGFSKDKPGNTKTRNNNRKGVENV